MSGRTEPKARLVMSFPARWNGTARLELRGVICTVAANRIGARVETLARLCPYPLDIDLGGVGFMDARGAALVATTARILDERGAIWRISRSSPAVRQVFGLVGLEIYLDDVFNTE